MKCTYCDEEIDEGQLRSYCSMKLGIANGPAAREKAPCRRCSHPQVIRAFAREFITIHAPSAMPMTVTADPVPPPRRRGRGDSPHHVDPEVGHGVLEMYVCRRCGFTEWYCRDPQNIPIGVEYGTELLEPEAASPYR